ncbi:MAG: hypothetical protein DIU54_002365 [Acidobacteriota bacterium]|jgi:hypothetical protein|nr:MAG: hypothetical protein DIU54_04920 [Acidobacteriota bacterium]
MYVTLLVIHSLLRWIVLVAAVIAIARAWSGWTAGRAWTAVDDRVGRQFLLFFDLQFLVGLLLYAVFSPLTRAAFTDFGAAMRDSVLRFFAVEHIFGMVVALALAHIGRGRLRRLTDDTARHRTMAIFFTLALVIMLVTIPWPFMPAGRPYFRGF